MGLVPWTSLRDLWRRGDRAEMRRLIRRALLQTGGDISRAAWVLFVSRKQLYRWIVLLQMYVDVDQIRARGDDPLWRARTAAALGGHTMSAWEKVMAGIQGLTAEEVAAALRASKHAARIADVEAFAEALVQAAQESA